VALTQPDGYSFRRDVMPAGPPEPECPAGWITGAPDFVGVGFQRCGTSRWWELLTAHPEIHRPEDKELHFFDRFQGSAPSAEIAEAYHRRFPRPPGLLCGEWTPRYALDHWAPALLRFAAPDALLLVSLRDPVERFSGITWAERRDVRSDDNVAAQLFRSAYLPQLRHLLRYADRDRLVVLQFERSLLDPGGELRRVYTAFGVDPSFEPELQAAPVNASVVPGEITTTERRELVEWLEPTVGDLAAEFPELDMELWPNFAYLSR
jgi:hypothetical protein